MTAALHLSPAADAVIILGAHIVAPGVPGPAMQRRVAHGVHVFRRRRASHLVLSGGLVGAPPGEAVLMRELALAHGVADDRIVVEGRSRNTFENALFTGRIIRERQWREVVIVTDHFHLMRALYVFRRLGLAVVGEGVKRPDEVSRLYWYTAYLDEAVRTVRSASLFLIGAHKSEVDRVLQQ